MKRLFTLLLSVIPIVAMAQSLAVASFELMENDLTAVNEATKREDDNGEIAAVIKIETTDKAFVFDAGSIGVVHVD